MREMQNLEYSYIAKELSQLEGKHFSKIYKMGEKSYRIKIGDAQLIIELPIRLGIAKYISKAECADNFTEKQRKILDNQKLMRIYQCGKDRIIALDFEKNVLFLEMFSKGNIILTDKEGKAIEVLREEKWKDREIGKGKVYQEPKSETIEDVEKTLSEKYAIVCLLKLPLGKEYAKEMLARCEIEDKKPGNSLSKPEIKCLQEAYEGILKEQKPYLFLEDAKPVDYGLVKFKKHANAEAKEFPSLSEAMEEFYTNSPAEKKPNERMEKLKRRLVEQLSSLEKLKKEEIESKEKGDYIYKNYQQIEEILSLAKKAGINNLAEALKGKKILKIDKEKKEIEMELD